MNAHYTVIFDGTAKAPMGRLLFAPETAPVPPPMRVHGRQTGTVRALRDDPRFQDWFTMAEVCQVLTWDYQQVGSALANLQRSGEVERERKAVMRARAAGSQRYRFIK